MAGTGTRILRVGWTSVLCWLLCLHCFFAAAQNTIGIPGIVNYPKQTYNAGTQNWGIAQDRNGILYFANSQGLLSFDGTFWRLYPLPNKTIVRSVAVGENGRVYVGGQSEFGFFEPGKNGELAYMSLMPLVKDEAKDFTDVWNICIFRNKVFFRAYRKIFEYNGKELTVYNGTHWSFLGATSSSLLAFEYNRGLVDYQNGQWLAATRYGPLATDINIRSAVTIGRDSTLLATLTHGLYILHHDSISVFTTKDIEAIAGQNIYGALPIGSDHIALITNLSGCIIIDKSGKFIQKFSKKEGIQNNNVLSILLDRDKNLWLGLDNGIDLVLYSNAIRNIFPEQEDRNSGYTSIKFRDALYLGLASGAYMVHLDSTRDLSYIKGSFAGVDGSKGQVWNFSKVNDKLLMGHNGGAFVIENNKAVSIDPKTGFWDFQPLTTDSPSTWMLAGTYNGINFYQYRDGIFTNPKLNAHFESARFVVRHGNDIWIAHPFKGLYKVNFSDGNLPVVSTYADKYRFLSSNHNKLFRVGGRMILTTDKGIFEFSESRGDFVHSLWMEKTFGPSVSYLKEDIYGNVWFCKNKKVGVWDRSVQGLVFLPELNNRIQADGFENINVIDSNNVLIAGEKGFFHINYAAYKKNSYALSVLIRGVRSISEKDSLIYGGYKEGETAPALGYAFNSLRFQCSSVLYGQDNTIEYSYYLEGFDKSWSGWSKRTEKDYTNLPPGDYVFRIKCRNSFNNESPPALYSFRILPPWYRTWWAYALYALLLAGALYLFYKKQQYKYRRQQQDELQKQQRTYDEEQKRLQMQYRLELSESDKQIAQLRNEKLQVEVEHKNSELASSALSLVHKAEILSKIKENLIQVRETNQSEKGAKEFQKLIKLIDVELSQAQEWEQFARHFDHVHTNYLKKLKTYCPDLTASDLKLAAYLRLSLSTKEIAQLMNISTRGVETSRYRLRKKLGLTNDEANLYDYLLQITGDGEVSS
jgi:DNA-binding CsgD family transcriptional regulator